MKIKKIAFFLFSLLAGALGGAAAISIYQPRRNNDKLREARNPEIPSKVSEMDSTDHVHKDGKTPSIITRHEKGLMYVTGYMLAIRGYSIGLLECLDSNEVMESSWKKTWVMDNIQQIRALNATNGWQTSRVCLPPGDTLDGISGCEPRAVCRYSFSGDKLAALSKCTLTEPSPCRIRAASASDYAVWCSSFLRYRPTQCADESELSEDQLVRVFCNYVNQDSSNAMLLAVDLNTPELLGFALLSSFSNPDGSGQGVAYLKDLFVESGSQRRGIGKVIVSSASTWARSKGINELKWFCIKSNNKAMGFYDKIGATHHECDNWWHIN